MHLQPPFVTPEALGIVSSFAAAVGSFLGNWWAAVAAFLTLIVLGLVVLIWSINRHPPPAPAGGGAAPPARPFPTGWVIALVAILAIFVIIQIVKLVR